MRILIAFLSVVFLSANVQAAGFVDPWASGSGFDDPWKKKALQEGKPSPGEPVNIQETGAKTGAKNRAADPAMEKSRPDKKRQAKNEQPKPENSVIPRMGETRKKVEEAAKKTVQPKPDQNEPPASRGAKPEKAAEAADEREKVVEKLEISASKGERATPLGHEIGESYKDASDGLGMIGFFESGRCGKGTMFFIDPANACVAVGLVQQKGVITGYGAWLSKRCLSKNPALETYREFAASGGETDKGYVRSLNYPGFMACVEEGGISGREFLPRFLGILRPDVNEKIGDAILRSAGGKFARKYRGGSEWTLNGAAIFREYCPEDGGLVRIGARVDNENPKIRGMIDGMGILKDQSRYGNIVMRVQREKGVVKVLQWDVLNHRCGRKV